MPQRCHKYRIVTDHRRAFTLIELLGVLTIMAVLLGLAIPSIHGYSQAEALGMSGNKLANLISLARQNSMSKNVMTALVMLKDPALGQSNSRTFALYEFVPPTNGSAPSSNNWTQLTKWETLNAGIVVDNWAFTSTTPSPLPTSEALPPLTYIGASTSTYNYVVFLPGGNLLENSPLNIRLALGVFPPATTTVQYTETVANGTPVNYYNITVLSYTGQVKITQP